MSKTRLASAAVVALLACALAGVAFTRSWRATIVEVNPSYEAATAIRPSKIPGAGNGLFALRLIPAGAVIGELGGRLIDDADPANGNHYTAALSACAQAKVPPYERLDSLEYGGHVSRINFAPREINGVPTNLQNAAIEQRCGPPFVVFVAVRDIKPGEEILSSYGPAYDYGFMQQAEVRGYFCQAAGIDCAIGFSFEP